MSRDQRKFGNLRLGTKGEAGENAGRNQKALRPLPGLSQTTNFQEVHRGRVAKRDGVRLRLAKMQGASGKTSGRSIFPNAPLRATSSDLTEACCMPFLSR